MREILFRGKKTGFNEWVQGYIASPCKNTMCILKEASPFIEWYVDAETVGQYTGLTDKNGTKIFEGDILEGRGSLLKVYFDTNFACFDWDLISGDCYENLSGFADEYEIVGNIHDNPELLKGGAL